MKLTTEQINYLKTKKPYQNEGFIRQLFGKILSTKLKNDTSFKNAVDKADSAMNNLQKSIRDAESKGVKVPDELKRYAGIKK